MSHSYNPGYEFDDHPATFGRRNNYPILTVSWMRNSVIRNEVKFYRNPNDELVLNPWTEDLVVVAGEDLFALREFLAEFPEEAFVRPADPVRKPRWTDGDKVLEVSRDTPETTWLRERVLGVWPVTKVTGGGSTSGRAISDEDLDGYMRGVGNNIYVVVRQQSEGVEL